MPCSPALYVVAHLRRIELVGCQLGAVLTIGRAVSRVPGEAPKEIDMLIAMCTDPDPSLRPTAKEIIQHIITSPSDKPGK